MKGTPMRQPRIGLLGLYLELYDRAMPQVRPRVDAFYGTIAQELGRRGLAVTTAPVCRQQPEFAQAVAAFEQVGVDAIVTLHLAYSPSLEAADVLAGTRLPIIVLDTTPAAGYGPGQDPDALMFNHGIHGVQDLCSVLRGRGKRFQVEAGHCQQSDVLDRIAGWAQAAALATGMRQARVGIIGAPFPGMGDFAVPFAALRESIGMEVIPAEPSYLAALVPSPDAPTVAEEMAADREAFDTEGLDADSHRESVRAGLAVRRWLEEEDLSAFTCNFLDIGGLGLPTVPFLEASKAMARGLGYAGEGDVLTAALVGVLAQAAPTTFTEMFCPDWAGNRVFLSHMGEVNPDLLTAPGLVARPFPWAEVRPPVHPAGMLQAGEAALVNLAPVPGTYQCMVWPVDMVAPEGPNRMEGSIHGWLAPRFPVAEFLASYSRLGGTHHCALVYGAQAAWLAHRLAVMMDWEVACWA